MGYTKADIRGMCETALIKEPHLFYKQGFINYRGKTSDTDEYYTEIVAEYLCDNIDRFKSAIPMITREKSYKTCGHDGVFDDNSNRLEEIIAMKMFNQGQLDLVGKVIDYQTPLKNSRCDEAGKIDLLSYDGKTVYILELKKPESDETMLRCVLEGYTYMRTANLEKLLKNFGLPSDTTIKACPFVFKNKVQHEEFKQNRPWLNKLMTELDSKPYFISEIKSKFIVEG